MKPKALLIALVWPEPTSSAAGWHMMQLIKALKSKGFQLSFACTSQLNNSVKTLEDIGVRTQHIKVNDPSFDELVRQLNPDLVIFDRFMTEEQFGWRVAENCPLAVRVLNTEDLHGLRKGRMLAYEEGRAFNKNHLFNDTMLRELSAIWRSDLSIIISAEEWRLLQNSMDTSKMKLVYFPFAFEKDELKEARKYFEFEKSRDFYSIGNFNHAPNKVAVERLVNDIWPKIKACLPAANLHIYGAFMPDHFKERTDPEKGIYFKGYLKDISELRDYRVCLAPLEFGAGLKGKLFEAILFGNAFVTTEIGFEGIKDEDLKKMSMARDDASFVDLAVTFYNEERTRKIFCETGLGYLKKEHDFDRNAESLIFHLNEVLKDPESWRTADVRSKVLLHQSNLASKYLAKYIEEKNKGKSI